MHERPSLPAIPARAHQTRSVSGPCATTDALCSGAFTFRFSNPLPEVPVDAKLLVHHMDKDALVKYRYDSAMETAQQ